MSKQKHAPEPWSFSDKIILDGESFFCHVIDGKGNFFLKAYFHAPYDALVSILRIITCVNHARGATNEELNAKSHADLIDQRDYLIVIATMLKRMVIDQAAGYKLEPKMITDVVEMLKSAIGDTVVKDRNDLNSSKP